MFSLSRARHDRSRLHYSLRLLCALPLCRGAALFLLVTSLPLGLTKTTEPTTRSDRLASYAEKVASLRSEAIRTGAVNYSEILHAIYWESDLQPILVSKTQWRTARGQSSVYLTDYQSLAASASVAEVKPIRNPQLGSTMIGRYEPRIHAIKIADTASDFAIVHEAGHALQRQALSDRSVRRSKSISFTDIELNLSSYAKRPGIDPVDARRLRYLASQDEFEVRLQDLNRFYAVAVAGRPIMNTADTIDALARLGLQLDPATLHWATQGVEPIEQERIQSILERAYAEPIQTDLSRFFDDAYELRMLQTLSQRIDGDLWRTLLRKIVLEAPGHI